MKDDWTMQGDDVFCDMINSIQFLNMSKLGGGKEGTHASFNDSGFNSGAEMNADNIFFYEDSCPSLASVKGDDSLQANASFDHQLPSPNYQNAPSSSSGMARERSKGGKELTQIQVNVGIDEDLKMILEMDPSLMDETVIEKAVEPTAHVVDGPKILGLPPKM